MTANQSVTDLSHANRYDPHANRYAPDNVRSNVGSGTAASHSAQPQSLLLSPFSEYNANRKRFRFMRLYHSHRTVSNDALFFVIIYIFEFDIFEKWPFTGKSENGQTG